MDLVTLECYVGVRDGVANSSSVSEDLDWLANRAMGLT